LYFYCLLWALWSGAVLVDGFIKTGCRLFELDWADISKMTMPSFPIVKYFDVLEHIGTGEHMELKLLDEMD
jgi:hypothetical protein